MLNQGDAETKQAVKNVAPSTSSTCAMALRNIGRLSEMSVATHEAVEQLQGLVAICNDASTVVRDIRQKIEAGDEATDPDELIEALTRLNEMSAAVRQATDAADGSIVAFKAASS